jgi:hypothetical protein
MRRKMPIISATLGKTQALESPQEERMEAIALPCRQAHY